MRHSRLLSSLAAGVLVAGLGSCTDDGSEGEATTPPTTQSTKPSIEPRDSPPVALEVAVTDLDAGPVGLVARRDGVWSALPESGQVRTGDGRTVQVGTNPLRLASTDSGVWVSVITDGKLVRIDPASGKVDLKVRLKPAGTEPEGLAVVDGTVWVVDQANWRLLPVDAATGSVGRAVNTGPGPRLVSAGPTGLWVGDYIGESLTHVPPDGRATTKSLQGCSPQGLAEAAGLVWVACTFENLVLGVDARTLQVEVRLEGIDTPDAVISDGSDVYVVGQSGPTVYPIDTETRQLGDPVVLDSQPAVRENVDAVMVDDALVVSHPGARRLYTVPLDLLS